MKRLTAVFLGLILGPVTVYGAERPNIVLLIADDQHWADFGFMGSPIVRTPNLDRLARNGLLYKRGYVPSSLCRPSLASIVTGLYPHQHRITGNDPDLKNGVRSADRVEANEELIRNIELVPTLPRILAEAGYLSFQSGKWWEGSYRRGGFTHGMTHGDPGRGGRHGDEGLKIGREGLEPVFRFLKDAAPHPFFLWYAPFLPHTPHTPPGRLLDRYLSPRRPVEVSRYFAMCEWFDETVGSLLDFLEREGLAATTAVILIVDNGWIQRTRYTLTPSGWRFGFAPKSKRSANEGGIRTPIIVNWPGHVDPAIVQTPVSSLDLAPTALSIAGFEPPAEMPGVNLLDDAAVARRQSIFGEVFTHDVVDPADPVASLKQRWCIQGRWKLIVPHLPTVLDSQVQLYDVVADPDEEENLLRRQPDLAHRMYEALQRWWPVE